MNPSLLLTLALAVVASSASLPAQTYLFTTPYGQPGQSGSANGTAAARFNQPVAVAFDASGHAYVGETGGTALRKISPAGVVTSLADLPNPVEGLAVDAAGNVFVADAWDHVIRKVTPAGAIAWVAGGPGSAGNSDGSAAAARFNGCRGVAVDAAGNLYVADTGNHTLRRITPAGTVTTLAGLAGVAGGNDGSGATARFSSPAGVAVDGSGGIYVADTGNTAVRRVTAAGVVSTLAGSPGNGGYLDGTGGNARLYGLRGIAVGPGGDVVVTDNYYNVIRRISPFGVVTTIGGVGSYTTGNSDGAGTLARFAGPQGVAMDAAGNLLVADTGNHTLRRGTLTVAPLITAPPVNQGVLSGQPVTFAVSATGTGPLSYQWQRQAKGETTFAPLAADGTYADVTTATLTIRAAIAAMDGDSFRCVVDNAAGVPAISAVATLRLHAGPAFTSADSAIFYAGVTGTFRVVASGSPAPVLALGAGTLPEWLRLDEATGVLSGTPPVATSMALSFTLVANNGVGPPATQTFTLAVAPTLVMPAIATTTPARQTVAAGQPLVLVASTVGSAPLSLQWKRNGRAIPGATTATYSVARTTPGDAGYYQLVAANPGGTVVSAALFVQVQLAAPQIVVWGANTYGQTALPTGLNNLVAVAAGSQHSLALKADGTVVAWGYSGYGQAAVPAGLANVVAVAGGANHSVALKADGSVVAWGETTAAAVPAGLAGVVAIAAGSAHTLALKADGTVVAWGQNSSSQCTVPVGLGGVVGVAGGATSSFALLSTGTVVAWGASSASAVTPDLVGVTAVGGGSDFGVALKSFGTVTAWGSSYSSGLKVPAALAGVTALSVRESLTLVLRADGTVAAWGDAGNLGATALPAGLRAVAAVAAGSAHGVALRDASGDLPPQITAAPATVAANLGQSVLLSATATAGTAALTYQWYKNEVPISGATLAAYTAADLTAESAGAYVVVAANSLGSAASAAAVVTVNRDPVVSATAGGRYRLLPGQALTLTLAPGISAAAGVQWRRNGRALPGATARSLGLTRVTGADSGYYQAISDDGTGPTASGAVFVQVVPATTQVLAVNSGSAGSEAIVPAGLTNAAAVFARGNQSAAIRANGTVVAWGGYSYSSYTTPPADLGNVVSLALGVGFSLAVKGDGQVVGWGDPYSSARWTPPAGLANVVAVAVGNSHAVALRADGTVAAWGTTGTAATVPAGWTNLIGIAAGTEFTVGLRADGTVVGSGGSYGGSVPAGLAGVSAIAAGPTFALALKQDGTVVAWGGGSMAVSAVPAGLGDVVAIAAGDSHAIALKRDGTVVAWGAFGTSGNLAPPALTAQEVFGVAGGQAHALVLRDATGDTAPTITVQPGGVAAYRGQTVVLRVGAAAGTSALVYQWRKDGLPLAGGTTAQLTLSQVTVAQAGSYDVVVANYLGLAASQAVTVGVSATAGVSTNLAGRRVVAAGQPVTMAASAALPGPVTYQWRRDGRLLAGATNATLALPAATRRLAGVYQVIATNSAGPAASAPVFLAVDDGAEVRAWGSNDSGQATLPEGLVSALAVAAGDGHSLALRTDGTVVAWGANQYGQTLVPAGLRDVVAIAAGAGFSLALRADGTVSAWGIIGVVPTGLADVVAIAAGNTSVANYSSSGSPAYALALRSNGTVVAWNPSGVLADASAGLTDLVAVSAGNSQRLALQADGTLLRWVDTSAAAVIASGVAAVASGVNHDLALKTDGTVVASTATSAYNGETAVPSSLADVVAIAAGGLTSVAVKADGSVVAWGYADAVTSGAAAQGPLVAVALGSRHAIGLRDGQRGAAPAITAWSPAQTVIAGQAVTLAVTATGTPAPGYQWYRNGVALTGATNSSYTLGATSTSQAGNYSVTVYNAFGAVTSGEITLVVNPTLNQRGLLTSATRAHTGAAGLLTTFLLEGVSSKQVLARASGPALAAFGVAGVLADPQINLTAAAGTVLATNDDWGTASNVATVASSVGAYAFAAGSKDAALLRTLPPGAYHAAIGGGAGVAMLELYDADAAARLVYLGTQAFAGTGAEVLVQGFTLAGAPAGRSYLIRALGPALASAGALADPWLTVTNTAGTTVAANDNWGGDAALAALGERVGAMPLAADSKDAALVFIPAAAGVYTVQVGGSAGQTGVVLLEIFEIDAQRAATIPPAIVAPPRPVTTLLGQPARLGVIAIGRPAPTYQWRKNGVNLPGATGAALTLPAVGVTDAADYTVVVASGSTTVSSGMASLSVASVLATHGVVGPGYVAGSTVTITNTIAYEGSAAGLGWQVSLPSGWSFAADGGASGDVKPAVGTTGQLEWAWTTPPPSPVVFTYTLQVPAGASGAQALAAAAILRAGTEPVTAPAGPGALAVGAAPSIHSADTNRDLRVSLLELTRVIELYNTRNGTARTGCYRVDASGEDGFAADPARAAGTTAALATFHSADANRDGRLSLLELTRVIELYNTRSGTTRTGQYHVQAGTEDGFGAGP